MRGDRQGEGGGGARGVGGRLGAVIRKRRMRARLLTKTVSLDIGERWEAVVTGGGVRGARRGWAGAL